MDSKQLAASAAWLADQKKADSIVVYDVAERFKVADYYVIVTGTSRPHVKALYDELHVRLKAAGEQHRPVEGSDLGWWILLDFGDVIVHLLQPDAREYYDLDHLYGECDQLDWREIELPEIPDPVHHRRAE
ncbi:MAG: ribosome silencing factor [Planctomycetota bacterium]|nr:ribosome silencing factor [Planctomycetota bacterium]